jgi:hypothetical protein
LDLAVVLGRERVADFSRFDTRRPAMAGADRMTIEEVVRKVLIDEHADVIGESVRWVVAELIGAGGLRAGRR